MPRTAEGKLNLNIITQVNEEIISEKKIPGGEGRRQRRRREELISNKLKISNGLKMEMKSARAGANGGWQSFRIKRNLLLLNV